MTEIMDVLTQMIPRPSEMESPYVKTLRAKQDLLVMLLENEHARLTTWLFPLDTGRKTHYTFRSPADVSATLVCRLDKWFTVIFPEYDRHIAANCMVGKSTIGYSAYQTLPIFKTKHKCQEFVAKIPREHCRYP